MKKLNSKLIGCCQITLLMLLMTKVKTEAHPWRVAQIPNGNRFGCLNCHQSSYGGSRNSFGLLVGTAVGRGSNAPFWSSVLAAKDSDGDGYSNGEELGDPDGDGKPTNAAKITNPGDSRSKPKKPAQPNEDTTKPEIKIVIENGELSILIKLNEPFRWKNTRYESLKKFPQPWIGLPDIPNEIWLRDKGNMEMRITDMMFMGNYEELDKYKIEASLLGLGEVIGIFNPETNLLNFDKLDYSPYFIVPEIVLEKSNDMRSWKRVKLPDVLAKEYKWQEEIKIEIQMNKQENTFYRIRIEED
ncbi:MAG: hypothetical protein QF685_01985 [Verrucomicrobiota bacterium]|nr:hypothetical protein [Verrucomicrobiota bacterium]